MPPYAGQYPYTAAPGAITVVVPANCVGNGDETFRMYANTMLRWKGAVGTGMVHSWRYSNGDVRCTFHPDR